MSIVPDQVSIRTHLGNTYSRTPAHFTKAEAHYLEALSLQPLDPGKSRNIGVLYARSRRPQEASEHFRTAHELAPKDAKIAEFLYGTLAEQGQGRAAEATSALQGLIALSPSHPLRARLNA